MKVNYDLRSTVYEAQAVIRPRAVLRRGESAVLAPVSNRALAPLRFILQSFRQRFGRSLSPGWRGLVLSRRGQTRHRDNLVARKLQDFPGNLIIIINIIAEWSEDSALGISNNAIFVKKTLIFEIGFSMKSRFSALRSQPLGS